MSILTEISSFLQKPPQVLEEWVAPAIRYESLLFLEVWDDPRKKQKFLDICDSFIMSLDNFRLLSISQKKYRKLVIQKFQADIEVIEHTF